jgi:glycosyltransferase involved in cell wall biosynthesis
LGNDLESVVPQHCRDFESANVKVLQLTHRLPVPPVDGGKKGILGFVRQYSTRLGPENLALMCLAPIEEAGTDLSELKALASICQVSYGQFRNRPFGVLRNSLLERRIPYNMEKYISTEYLEKLQRLVEIFQPDVIHCDHLHTAWYAAQIRRYRPDILLVLREHNVESTIIGRLADRESNPLKRAVFRSQADKLYKFESEMLKTFDLIFPITTQDSDRIRKMTPAAKLLVIPAGTEMAPSLPPLSHNGGKRRILHIAAMDWKPNQDGLTWFVREVMPKLRAANADVVLDVIGKNAPAKLQQEIASNDVVVHGFVQDLRNAISQATVAIVPLHVGGGMRVKILDYFGQGVPVVSTSIGAEGISDGSDGLLLVANSASGFADAILKLVADAPLRASIREAAYAKCRSEYGWDSIGARTIDAIRTELQLHRNSGPGSGKL